MQIKTFGVGEEAPVTVVANPYDQDTGTQLISALTPDFMLNLNLAVDAPVQCVVYEPVSQQYFTSQAVYGTNASSTPYQTTVISRCDAAGTLLDSMTLLNAGSGFSFGVQNVSGTIVIWLTFAQGVDLSLTPAYDFLKFNYVTGTFDRTQLTNLTVLSKFDAGDVTEQFDWASDTVVFRQAGDTVDTYIRRNISDIQNGVNRAPVVLVLQQNPPTVQGFTSVNDTLFRFLGAVNGEQIKPVDPTIIQQYSLKAFNRLDQQAYPDLGRTANGTFPDNRHEPHSLTMYRDPVTGYASLIFCVTLGTAGDRTYPLWRIPNIGTPYVKTVTAGLVGSAIVGTDLVG